VNPQRRKHLSNFLEAPYQLEQPIKYQKRTEVQEVISNLNPKKSLGYDLITLKILEELPIIGVKFLIRNSFQLNPKWLKKWRIKANGSTLDQVS
jgi:hypothetical protein